MATTLHDTPTTLPEEEPQNSSESLAETPGGSSRKLCIGYLLLILLNLTDSSPVVFAQMAVGKSSIFELNSIRFATQALLCYAVCLLRGRGLRVSLYWYLLPVASIMDYVFAVFVYLGASYMPVGNVFGVFVACYVFFTISIDLCRRRVTPVFLVAGVPAIMGILLLSQPWHFARGAPPNHCIPCDIMDTKCPINTTLSQLQPPEYPMKSWLDLQAYRVQAKPDSPVHDKQNQSHSPSRLAHSQSHALTLLGKAQSHSPVQLTDGQSDHSMCLPEDHLDHPSHPSDAASHISRLAIGYCLLVASALASCISSNCCSKLVSRNDPFAVTFWTSSLEGLLSILLTLATQSPDQGRGWALPSGAWCLTFTLLFTSMGAINDIVWFVTFCFLPVSHVSVGTSPTVLLLYLSQRTFLARFYPGNANALEVTGAVLVFVGVLMSPLLAMCDHRYKSGYTRIEGEDSKNKESE